MPLTLEEFGAVQRMASFGHHLGDQCRVTWAGRITPDEWRSLKRWPLMHHEDHPVGKLEIDDPIVEEMTASWQAFHSDSGALEALVIDGLLGPKTILNVWEPRCGCPDIRPDEAIAESSWHPTCRSGLTWALQGGGFALPGQSMNQVTRAFDWAYEYIGSELEGVAFQRRDDLGERVNTFSRPRRLGGSTLARHTLPPNRNTSCSFYGWGEYDSDRQWSDLAYLVAVIIHEEGHGLGWSHVRQSSGGIMTPAINSGAVSRVEKWITERSGSVYNAADWKEAGDNGYLPRTTPPSPPPPVPGPVGEVQIEGRLTVAEKATGRSFGEFIVTPVR